jgi:hypothetical protein
LKATKNAIPFSIVKEFCFSENKRIQKKMGEIYIKAVSMKNKNSDKSYSIRERNFNELLAIERLHNGLKNQTSFTEEGIEILGCIKAKNRKTVTI